MFGASQEERLRNISIEDENKEVLAEDTMLKSDTESERERDSESDQEKENIPKKKKAEFGSAKVLNQKMTKKVKKKRYTVGKITILK